MFFLLFACTATPKESSGDSNPPAESVPDSESPTDSDSPTDSEPVEEPTWSYEGETGPEHWGELSEEWALCGTGTQQSPVDIDPAVFTSTLNDISLHWTEINLRAYNSGHYIRYEVDEAAIITEAGYVMAGSDKYIVKQFHFHALSEHTVVGQHLGMEMHVVHQKEGSTGNDDLLVVGVFFDSAGEYPTSFLTDIDMTGALTLAESEEPTDLGKTYDMGKLEASVANTLSYMGSLTTPPCTEGVRFVLSGNLQMPAAGEVEAFQSVYDFNYRPTQPLNGREISVLVDG